MKFPGNSFFRKTPTEHKPESDKQSTRTGYEDADTLEIKDKRDLKLEQELQEGKKILDANATKVVTEITRLENLKPDQDGLSAPQIIDQLRKLRNRLSKLDSEGFVPITGKVGNETLKLLEEKILDLLDEFSKDRTGDSLLSKTLQKNRTGGWETLEMIQEELKRRRLATEHRVLNSRSISSYIPSQPSAITTNQDEGPATLPSTITGQDEIRAALDALPGAINLAREAGDTQEVERLKLRLSELLDKSEEFGGNYTSKGLEDVIDTK